MMKILYLYHHKLIIILFINYIHCFYIRDVVKTPDGKLQVKVYLSWHNMSPCVLTAGTVQQLVMRYDYSNLHISHSVIMLICVH